MFRKLFSYFTLPLLLVLSNSSGNSAPPSPAKNRDAQTGTLEKMIVANGNVAMDLDLSRLNGTASATQESKRDTLRFQVGSNSFFTILVFENILRGPEPGSMGLIAGNTAANLPGLLQASLNQLIIEKLSSDAAFEMAVRDGKTGFVFFNIEGHLYDYDPAAHVLSIRDGRLLLSGEFASKLGRPADAGLNVGGISIATTMYPIEITTLVDGTVQSSVLPTRRGGTPDGVVPGPDVIVGDLPSMGQFGSSGTQVGLAVGTTSCNNGNVPLDWFALSNTDHPVIPQNLYRMSGGASNNDRFEQIGQSWLKHAFTALEDDACGFGCNTSGCTTGTHLCVGCSDPYSSNLNASQGGLGSRAWVNPFTGAYPSTSANHSGHTHTGTTHRILTEMADLDTTLNPGATYYADAQYVTPHEYVWCQSHPGECNMYNNASYRRFNVSGTTSFTFSAVGSTVRMTPAINAWTGATINPIEPDPGVDGRAFIAYKVTGPVSGAWHYEYAISNQNLDRAIQSFSVPLPAGTNVSNLGFHAPLNHPGIANDGTQGSAGFSNTPWASNQAGGALSWSSETFAQNQNANAIRWGTLYNFRFDSNSPPQTTNATIGFYKTGAPITVQIQGPAGTGTPTPTATGTPQPTATSTATSTPTATATPPCMGTVFAENFDASAPPALPAGWVATNAQGPGPLWVTSATGPDTPPNDAFVDDPDTISDKLLDTPSINIPGSPSQVTFRNNYNLESSFDGGVLEISINGGAFADIIDAGGSFVTGGYNDTISTDFGSPIGGRGAWSGDSGGYLTTTLNLPAAALGQNFKLRFRMASDDSKNATGWRVDSIDVTSSLPCGTATPTATATGTPLPTATATATAAVTPCADAFVFTESFDSVTAPALPAGWAATNAAGAAPLWVTSTTTPNTPPNDAFIDDPDSVSDKLLDTPDIAISGQGAQVSFRNFYNTESTFDGGVLEVSSSNINAGAFTDITDAAVGGSFAAGGYNATISTAFGSPISGRMAWSGNAGSYINTVANLGPNVVGHLIKLRFRMASDDSVSAEGWRVDTISVTVLCQSPTPSPTPTSDPTATATASGVTPTPTPTTTPTPGSTPASQPLNLSTRMRVDTGESVGIGGFIIVGTSPKRVIVRGLGPSLTGSGVPDALADPVLELHGPSGFTTMTNDNWRDTQEAEIIATGLQPPNDLESAIVATLDPGNYTAIVAGKNNTAGVALVEIYDLDPIMLSPLGANSKLGNISTRAFVSTGSNVVIAGFILGGNSADDNVILRGIGPSLPVNNALANPTLELHNSEGALVIGNNDWQDDAGQAAIISAAGLAPSNPLESGIAATLPAGLYTGILAGQGGGTGVGLVEVYSLGAGAPIPTPTPGNSPTPVPTATATATATAGGSPPPVSPTPSGPCVENFDGVTAPALPPGWVASNPDPGDGTLWQTSTATPDTAPNAVFLADQDGISDKVVTRTGVAITNASAVMSFRNNFNTEFSGGTYWDGVVLEVSAPTISGGDFLDITDSHVGGSFVSGGYTGLISSEANNPLAGRMAWSGDSGGYIDTVVNMGPNLAGQTVALRFRMGSDEAVAAPGANIDTIMITNASCPP